MLAHMGGADEAAVVVVALPIAAVLLWLAGRRGLDEEAVEKGDGEGEKR